jgi:hypothetical protein
MNQALRLLSRGYKIFSMQDPLFLSLDKTKEKKPLDPEWNWKNFKPLNLTSWTYVDHANKMSDVNYQKIFNGEYLGYWGAPDKKSLSEAKKIMGVKEIKNYGK